MSIARKQLLLANSGLCVHPAVPLHLEKVGGSAEDSQANGPFLLFGVIIWIAALGSPYLLSSAWCPSGHQLLLKVLTAIVVQLLPASRWDKTNYFLSPPPSG